MSNETNKTNETMQKQYFIGGCFMTLQELLTRYGDSELNDSANLVKDFIKTLKQVDELRRQNAALKEFANKVLNMAAEGYGIYDDEVQSLAEKLSLLVKKTATQEDLDSDEMLQMRYDLEVGGTFLDYADWMLTDTAMPAPSRKITVVRQNPKGYWEALSDGSKAFRGWYEAAEEEYEGDHSALTQEQIFDLFYVIVPVSEWQPQVDFTLDEIVKDFESQGYQVFVIQNAPSKAEVAREFLNAVNTASFRTGSSQSSVAELILKEWEDA